MKELQKSPTIRYSASFAAREPEQRHSPHPHYVIVGTCWYLLFADFPHGNFQIIYTSDPLRTTSGLRPIHLLGYFGGTCRLCPLPFHPLLSVTQSRVVMRRPCPGDVSRLSGMCRLVRLKHLHVIYFSTIFVLQEVQAAAAAGVASHWLSSHVTCCPRAR